VKFEPEPTGLKDAFPDWLYYMDVSKLHKVARETQFASKARGEVVRAPSAEKKPVSPLELAQQKLSEGDLAGAEKIARDVAGSNGADAPQAYFILGQTATLNRDKESAINNFNQALQTAKDPKLIAWAHIYLGRIYDVDQERDMAVKHYQAALRAGDDTPQTKAAAERGLQSPYQRRGSSDQEKQ
jgi:tetratricopeptide (TPR) repeat protein